MIELTDTTASAISAAFIKDRIKAGSPAMGMVLTLIVVTDEEQRRGGDDLGADGRRTSIPPARSA